MSDSRRALFRLARRDGGQSTSSRRVAALTLAALAASTVAHAAPPEVCRAYADQATSHENTNRERDCGFVGDRWSTNWNGHFQWCLGAATWQLDSENGARSGDLNRCNMCNGYANEAVDQQQRNEANRCGYRGDPWSRDRRGHLRWCLTAGQGAIDGQTNLRRAEVAKCEGCRTYADRAVNAFNATRICGYAGDRWSPDREGHFRWCTGVASSHSQSEEAAREAEAGKCQSCQNYATEAVAAQERNEAQQCGFRGNAWSRDRDGHLRWCAGAQQRHIDAEAGARSTLLFRCGQCQTYVTEAVKAQDENARLNCGLAGDQWSKDRGHHAAWCAVVNQGATSAETEARRLLLVNCAVPGRKQACQAYADTAVAQYAESGRLGCGLTGAPWSNHRQNHYNWCLGKPASIADGETVNRERDLANCRRAMSQPAPSQCTVSVVLRTNECLNEDGTPSSILNPGDVSGIGCGADEDTAEAAAKASLSSQRQLTEGDQPAPGACTYERESTFPGCLCSR